MSEMIENHVNEHSEKTPNQNQLNSDYTDNIREKLIAQVFEAIASKKSSNQKKP